ncbi:MAG: aminoacetone oxidase family FAD-binding enzyme [Alphaproteobacteria bacterium]|nr:aminoacetone oxidase family FAD-binding enzyme [Alphaproteobacteria bacterium]
MNIYDIIIIGAGAAGLSAARTAIANNKKILILEMANLPARKVAISGGGRCNITNLSVNYDRYFGNNPRFVQSAISKVKPTDVLAWATKHNLQPIEEKTYGRFFCNAGANAVKNALLHDIKSEHIIYNTKVGEITKQNDVFCVSADNNKYYSKSVIVATGGTSFDSVRVSDAGYKIAKHFGHKIVPVRPALCAIKTKYFPPEFSGISVPVEISIEKRKIRDDMLFTYFGIGGPAAYRASLYDINSGIYINLLPDTDIANILINAKTTNGRKTIYGILSEYLPTRIAKWIANEDKRRIADIKNDEIKDITNNIHKIFIPKENIQYHTLKTAEVVRGGVSTDEVSSKTMESKLCKNLFFVGEVLDIAGDLGGFNLHWAWASGIVAGQFAPTE